MNPLSPTVTLALKQATNRYRAELRPLITLVIETQKDLQQAQARFSEATLDLNAPLHHVQEMVLLLAEADPAWVRREREMLIMAGVFEGIINAQGMHEPLDLRYKFLLDYSVEVLIRRLKELLDKRNKTQTST